MNKRTLSAMPVMALAMLVMALAVLLIAGCAPATLEPTAVPTAAPPAAPVATQPPATPAAGVPPTPADTRPTVPAPPADGSRPLADLAPAERADRFSGPAAMIIKPDTIYLATIVTDKGNIVAELYQDTPQSANNFITLAQDGFYDGLTFHRVEPGFVIQGGDPNGDGGGGPGYTIPAEINHPHPRGALAWARTGDQVNPERRSSGSQFYITLDEASFLDGGYTVFGYVVEGMEVVDQIAVGDVITRIEISESTEPSRLPTPTPTPEPKAPVMEEGRPLAQIPVEGRDKIYNTAPALIIDPAKTYQATLTTDKGEIVIDLNAAGAPHAVNSFVLLANLGFYDGLPVAYVQPDNYAVMGSPAAQPDSDVGYALEPEVLPEGRGIITGTVSLYPVYDQLTDIIRASGSQFFISFTLAPDADTPLSVIGQVASGMEVATTLEMGDIITKIVIAEK